MRIRPIFAWYDFWIGFFVDRAKKRFYFFPIPCFGIVISWGKVKQYDLKNVTVSLAGKSLPLLYDARIWPND